MAFSLQDTVERSPNLVSSNLDGCLVMLNAHTGKYFSINPVGARIWELLQSPKKVSSIRDELLQEFEVSKEQCEQEVFEFLEQLSKLELAQKVSAV